MLQSSVDKLKRPSGSRGYSVKHYLKFKFYKQRVPNTSKTAKCLYTFRQKKEVIVFYLKNNTIIIFACALICPPMTQEKRKMKPRRKRPAFFMHKSKLR